MTKTMTVPVELIAALIEINSDLGYILEEGLDLDSMESIEAMYNRTTTLLEQVEATRRVSA